MIDEKVRFYGKHWEHAEIIKTYFREYSYKYFLADYTLDVIEFIDDTPDGGSRYFVSFYWEPESKEYVLVDDFVVFVCDDRVRWVNQTYKGEY